MARIAATCISTGIAVPSIPDLPVKVNMMNFNGMYYQFDSDKTFKEWKAQQSVALQGKL